jgi:cytoskeletal protein CcmA (bactofilin family)
MFGKNNSKPQNKIDSLVGAGTSILGDVVFTGGLRVDGEIKAM